MNSWTGLGFKQHYNNNSCNAGDTTSELQLLVLIILTDNKGHEYTNLLNVTLVPVMVENA